MYLKFQYFLLCYVDQIRLNAISSTISDYNERKPAYRRAQSERPHALAVVTISGGYMGRICSSGTHRHARREGEMVQLKLAEDALEVSLPVAPSPVPATGRSSLSSSVRMGELMGACSGASPSCAGRGHGAATSQ